MDSKETPEDAFIENAESQDDRTRRLERSLVRKLDMTLMPVVWLLYLFNYLDRNNIAQAKLNGLEDDLGLKGEQYNTAISILNVGYILMQLPSNMILTRVRPSLYIPLWVCAWSCISAATAATQNYQHLVVIRFFLGFAEAPFFPGAFYLLSCWYTKKELALRTAVLYSGLVLATAFSGLLAAGIFAGLDQVRGLEGWRWLFIIEGAASFAIAIAALPLIPDFPHSSTGSARWLLTPEERELAGVRIRNDQVSNQESNNSIWYGVKSALKDYRVFVFALMLCANHTAYGFNNFYPSIVKGFELGSTTITLVCTAPPYIVSTVVSFLVAWSSDRRNERCFHISASMGTAIVGFIISVSLTNTAGQYFSSFLYVSGCFAANSLVYTWAASAVSQTPEKRACATAIINLLGQMGNIWSPYFFRGQDAPRYILALILMIAFAGLSILTCLAMKWSLSRENKRLLAQYENTTTKPTLHTL